MITVEAMKSKAGRLVLMLSECGRQLRRDVRMEEELVKFLEKTVQKLIVVNKNVKKTHRSPSHSESRGRIASSRFVFENQEAGIFSTQISHNTQNSLKSKKTIDELIFYHQSTSNQRSPLPNNPHQYPPPTFLKQQRAVLLASSKVKSTTAIHPQKTSKQTYPSNLKDPSTNHAFDTTPKKHKPYKLSLDLASRMAQKNPKPHPKSTLKSGDCAGRPSQRHVSLRQTATGRPPVDHMPATIDRLERGMPAIGESSDRLTVYDMNKDDSLIYTAERRKLGGVERRLRGVRAGMGDLAPTHKNSTSKEIRISFSPRLTNEVHKINIKDDRGSKTDR